MNLTKEEIESLRIAIAEEMGEPDPHWECRDCGIVEPSHVTFEERHDLDRCKQFVRWIETPPYTTSLDTIQAAAMEQFSEQEHADFYYEMFSEAVAQKTLMHKLTPIDWSVAFARTAKIWKFKP